VTQQTGEHAATGHHLAGWIALGGLCLGALLLYALIVRCSWAARRDLRRCPRCGADAVRNARLEPLQVVQVRAELECGQCGTWRRLAIDRAAQQAHARRLGRHAQRMGGRLRQLETERRGHECDAFLSLLHTEIVGPEDFLARTRPPRRRARPPGDRRGPAER
jgi:hypothetical protein